LRPPAGQAKPGSVSALGIPPAGTPACSAGLLRAASPPACAAQGRPVREPVPGQAEPAATGARFTVGLGPAPGTAGRPVIGTLHYGGGAAAAAADLTRPVVGRTGTAQIPITARGALVGWPELLATGTGDRCAAANRTPFAQRLTLAGDPARRARPPAGRTGDVRAGRGPARRAQRVRAEGVGARLDVPAATAGDGVAPAPAACAHHAFGQVLAGAAFLAAVQASDLWPGQLVASGAHARSRERALLVTAAADAQLSAHGLRKNSGGTAGEAGTSPSPAAFFLAGRRRGR